MNGEDPKATLDNVCHTSERTAQGTVYTLSDLRFPELSGKQVLAVLQHGKTVFSWMN